MSKTSPQCQIGDHKDCKVISKSGIRCACYCHLSEQERQQQREQERQQMSAAIAAGFIPTYGPSNVDMERQFEAETGVKKVRSDRGMSYYDFADLDPEYKSSSCRIERHHECHDTRCHCACHQPEPTGSALIVTAPEVTVETIEQPSRFAPLPAGYAVAQNEAGRYVVIHNGQVMTKVLKSGEIRIRSYAHKSSARRFIRQHVGKEASHH